MLQQIVEAIVGLALLGGVVLIVASCTPLGLWWLWPSPRREERSERVIIVNNTLPAPAQPSGPSAGSVLALAVAALVVALTRRVEQPPLPAPTEPTDLPARYYDYRG